MRGLNMPTRQRDLTPADYRWGMFDRELAVGLPLPHRRRRAPASARTARVEVRPKSPT
jgi:hypothetical protein